MVAAAFPIEVFIIGGVRHTFDVDTVFARKLRSVIFGDFLGPFPIEIK